MKLGLYSGRDVGKDKRMMRYEDRAARYYSGDENYDRERWETEAGAWTARRQRELVEELLLGCPRNGHILEVGPGTGRFTVSIVDVCQPRVLTLADVSSGMLERAVARTSGFNCAVEAVEASVTGLPLESDSVDVCVAINILNHVPDQQLALQEISRVLKSRGCAVLNFNNLISIYGMFGVVANRRGSAFAADVPAVWTPLSRLRAMLDGAGLVVEEFIGHTHAPRPLDAWIPARPFERVDRWLSQGRLRGMAPVAFFLVKKL